MRVKSSNVLTTCSTSKRSRDASSLSLKSMQDRESRSFSKRMQGSLKSSSRRFRATCSSFRKISKKLGRKELQPLMKRARAKKMNYKATNSAISLPMMSLSRCVNLEPMRVMKTSTQMQMRMRLPKRKKRTRNPRGTKRKRIRRRKKIRRSTRRTRRRSTTIDKSRMLMTNFQVQQQLVRRRKLKMKRLFQEERADSRKTSSMMMRMLLWNLWRESMMKMIRWNESD